MSIRDSKIYLDGLSQAADEDARARAIVAFHEAAHAVMAIVMRLNFHYVTIKAGDEHEQCAAPHQFRAYYARKARESLQAEGLLDTEITAKKIRIRSRKLRRPASR